LRGAVLDSPSATRRKILGAPRCAGKFLAPPIQVGWSEKRRYPNGVDQKAGRRGSRLLSQLEGERKRHEASNLCGDHVVIRPREIGARCEIDYFDQRNLTEHIAALEAENTLKEGEKKGKAYVKPVFLLSKERSLESDPSSACFQDSYRA